jgi:hypothetical protein
MTAKGSLLGLENGEIDYTFPASGSGAGTYVFSGDLTPSARPSVRPS